MRKINYLVEIEIAGETQRYSDIDISIYSSLHARDLFYKGVIVDPIEWVDEIDIFGGGVNEPSISLTYISEISIGKLISEGHSMEYSPARIYLFLEGDTYEEAQLLLDGFATEWEWDTEGDPVVCTLIAKPVDPGETVPRSTEKISYETMGVSEGIPEDFEEKYYPLFFGKGLTATFGPTEDKRLPIIEAPKGKFFPLTIPPLQTIYIHEDHRATGWSLYVDKGWQPYGDITETDGINDTGDGFVKLLWETDETPTVGYDGSQDLWLTVASGGILFEGDYVETAEQLVRYLVYRSNAAFDIDKSAAGLKVLSEYKIHALIEEPVDVIEWLIECVFKYVPIAMKYGPTGLYLIPISKDAIPTSTIIVDGLLAERISGVKFGDLENVVNNIKIKGLYAPRGDIYLRRLYRDASTNTQCELSQDRFGVRKLELECPAFQDADTLGLVLNYYTDFYSQPYKRVAYSLPTSYSHLRAGDVVSITDDEIYISEQTCYVEEVAFRETSVDITVIYY